MYIVSHCDTPSKLRIPTKYQLLRIYKKSNICKVEKYVMPDLIRHLCA